MAIHGGLDLPVVVVASDNHLDGAALWIQHLVDVIDLAREGLVGHGDQLDLHGLKVLDQVQVFLFHVRDGPDLVQVGDDRDRLGVVLDVLSHDDLVSDHLARDWRSDDERLPQLQILRVDLINLERDTGVLELLLGQLIVRFRLFDLLLGADTVVEKIFFPFIVF